MLDLSSVSFGFVVLHYLIDDETKQCIESIRNSCNGYQYTIVVVDNNSANGSFERLQKIYDDSADIILLHNVTNEGFARGNNVGYQYCKEILKCHFIVTVNNDVQIESKNFIEQSVADFEHIGCGVIGPKIISGEDGSNQNPVRSVYDSHEKVEAVRKHIDRNLFLLQMHLMTPWKAVKKCLHKPQVSAEKTSSIPPIGQYKLHGSCLIFTPAYITQFDEAFDPRTFLYLEEDILYLRCRATHLSLYYDPRIVVLHKSHASTQAKETNKRRRQVQYLLHHRDSLRVLETYLESR